MAYVVRIDLNEKDPDYKAFTKRTDAEGRYWSAVGRSEVRSSATFSHARVRVAGRRGRNKCFSDWRRAYDH